MGGGAGGSPGPPAGALPAPVSGVADQGQTALDNPVDDRDAAGAFEAGSGRSRPAARQAVAVPGPP